MSAPILSQFAILEKRKAAFLLDLKTWTPRHLAFHPPRGGWSALEVLDHVVKTERGITEEMEKNLPDARRVSALDAVRSRLLIALMNSRLRVKVPIEVSARVWPERVADLNIMLSSWADSQRRVRTWIDGLGDDQTSFAVFRHPASGWMRPLEAIGFMGAHARHHAFQLRRISRQPGWNIADRPSRG